MRMVGGSIRLRLHFSPLRSLSKSSPASARNPLTIFCQLPRLLYAKDLTPSLEEFIAFFFDMTLDVY
jgi:hypothetical protein